MADLLLDMLTQVKSLLFSLSDLLNIGETLQNADVSITSSGPNTILASHAGTWTFDSAAFSSASQAGQISYTDGSHLIAGADGGEQLSGPPATRRSGRSPATTR